MESPHISQELADEFAIGGVAGFYGGWVDNIIQRLIEVLKSFPRLPLWMALMFIINLPATTALQPAQRPQFFFCFLLVFLFELL